MSVVFVMPMGESTTSFCFPLAFASIAFLTSVRFDEYGPSEDPRSVGATFAKRGRMVAIEAAMMPRFNSSLLILDLDAKLRRPWHL